MIQSNKLAGVSILALLLLAACKPQDSGTAEQTVADSDTGGISAGAEKENFGVSYMTGYQIGTQLKSSGMNIDTEVLAQAVSDAIGGKESVLTAEQQQAAVEAQRAAQQAAREKLRQERMAAAEANKAAGEAFLAENGAREGVVTTESGLQYEVISMADGAKPAAEDIVRVHYAGTLLDETPFDSSYQRGEPAEFPLNGVIRGWTEGLQLMPVGSKFKFFIPSDLAYGPQDRGAVIKANSTLIFEVELLTIVGDEVKSESEAVDEAAAEG